MRYENETGPALAAIPVAPGQYTPDKYYIGFKVGDTYLESEVSRAVFAQAERECGFFPRKWSGRSIDDQTLATGGFSFGLFRGRVVSAQHAGFEPPTTEPAEDPRVAKLRQDKAELLRVIGKTLHYLENDTLYSSKRRFEVLDALRTALGPDA